MLRALGLTDAQAKSSIRLSDREARSSIRLGFGRYTTLDEVEAAATMLKDAAARQGL